MKYRSTPGDPKKKKKSINPMSLRNLNQGGPFYKGRYNDPDIVEEIFDPETYEVIDGKLYYKDSGEEADPVLGPYADMPTGRVAPYEKTIFDYFTALFGK